MQIPRNRLPLSALRTFEAAARHLSLVRAAEELSVTHSAVSHQIRSLEILLRAKLFDREHRPIALTQAGAQLLIVVQESLDRLARTTSAIQSGEIEGEITLSCVPGLAANWLSPRLGIFLKDHANISIHVSTEHWRHPKAGDQFDIAIGYGSAEHPGRRVRLLRHAEFFPVCHPALFGKRGLRRLSDIGKHTLLHEYTNETWSRWFAASDLSGIEHIRGVYFDGAHLSLQAARAGYGIAMGDLATVKDDLDAGRLTRISDRAVPAAYPYCLIARPEGEQVPAARALEEWLMVQFEALFAPSEVPRPR